MARRGRPWAGAFLALLAGLDAGAAKTAPEADAEGVSLAIRVDPAHGRTVVRGSWGRTLCFAFPLAREWRVIVSGRETVAEAVGSGARLSIVLKAAHDLPGPPQESLTARAATLLQREAEALLGRAAQSVHLESAPAGAARWRAIWIDANLPAASHMLTFETLIVPVPPTGVVEVSFSEVESPQAQAAFTREILSQARVWRGRMC